MVQGKRSHGTVGGGAAATTAAFQGPKLLYALCPRPELPHRVSNIGDGRQGEGRHWGVEGVGGSKCWGAQSLGRTSSMGTGWGKG